MEWSPAANATSPLIQREAPGPTGKIGKVRDMLRCSDFFLGIFFMGYISVIMPGVVTNAIVTGILFKGCLEHSMPYAIPGFIVMLIVIFAIQIGHVGAAQGLPSAAPWNRLVFGTCDRECRRLSLAESVESGFPPKKI